MMSTAHNYPRSLAQVQHHPFKIESISVSSLGYSAYDSTGDVEENVSEDKGQLSLLSEGLSCTERSSK